MKHTLVASVKDGKVQYEHPELVKRVIQSFEGKRIIISVEKWVNKRSYLQNRYYWGTVVELLYVAFRDFGEDVSRETVHEMLKAKFLERTMTDKNSGEIIGHYSGSTADLTTVEFMEYVERIQMWAMQTFEINIPEPDKEWRTKK